MISFICAKCSQTAENQIVIPKKPDTLTLTQGWEVTFFDTIFAIKRAVFPSTQHSNDFFLQFDYLATLEDSLPKGIEMSYLLFQKNGITAGLATLQIKRFNAAESLRKYEQTNTNFLNKIKNFVTKLIDFNVITIGNLLLTGEHGVWFDKNLTHENEFFETIKKSMRFAEERLKTRGKSVSALFWKDFYTQKPILTSPTEGGEIWNEFQVEENFVLALPENWQTMDDYLAALHSKARMRTKRALKKAVVIERKNFNVERIKAYQLEIHALYLQISRNASFNLFELPPDYWVNLKTALPDAFNLWGYFLDGKLVAFYTTFKNGNTLDAHFLGYDHVLNNEYQLYLNSLYDILDNALTMNRNGATIQQLVFGRTAAEIKSSVGAKAKPMYLYWRHRFEVVNCIFPRLFRWLSPKHEWQERHPFK